MVDRYLLTVTAYDRDAASVVTRYWGSSSYATGPSDTPANVIFEGVLAGFVFDRSASAPGVIGGASLGGQGSFAIAIPQQWRDDGTLADLLGYAWDGRAFTLERIASGDAYADRTTIAAGTATALSQGAAGELQLQVHDQAEDFRVPLQASRYTGAGGFNGTVDLTDRPKPLVFGEVINAPTVPVDPANLWFDIHDGQIEAIDAVRDNGVALLSSVSSPPAAGYYYADLANGRVQLGDQPEGAVTVDVQGAAPSGVWKDDLADVVRHAVVTYGGLSDPGDLDTAAFTTLATARPGVVGFATGAEEITLAELLDALVGGQGGYWGFSRAGLFTLGVLAAPTATAETDAAIAATVDAYRIERGTLRRLSVGVPPSTVRVQYRRLGLVQSADELADSVTAANRLAYSTPYRIAPPTDTATLAAIAAAHLRARPLDVEAFLLAEGPAEDLADALLGLLDGLVPYEATADAPVGSISIGDQVWLAHDDYAISAGVAARVQRVRETMSGGVTLEVFTT